ncbi:type II secretion system protein [Marinobacter sp. ATCH36]|uniref:type II secretion system protein n=1 Tax=Marinobacter sp. ATCH36 TaxID=2945106 RepID=UPI0020218FEA|nr:type II secretion system protein [Marinobacter sp. ATCH36]MCL7945988.1 type II secretion system GspH family protein [Marinobacter sp. ATCH36]
MTIKNAPSSSGFTLVELVMVIILIGVLSVLGIGLFAGRSAFSPLLATQQLASATLLVQQAALAGNPSNTLTISQTGDRLVFDAGINQFEITREGATLSYRLAGGSYTNVPASGFNVTFSPMGRVSGPVARESIDFRLSGESQFDLCLSSLGAVYTGTCQ